MKTGHYYDIMTKLAILDAKMLRLESYLQQLVDRQPYFEATPPSEEPQYNYPKSTLKGDGTDSPVQQTQYNNVDYTDYEGFLQGWIAFYESIGNNCTEDNKLKLAEYRKELERIRFEGRD